MNIDWAIPCRYVEVHDNLGTIVGAGIDTFWIPDLPQPLQVILAVRLLAMAEELDPAQQHTATNRVLDPHGALLTEVGGPFSVGGESANPDWLTGITVATVLQFEVSEAGTHTIELRVDDGSISLPIHIVEGYSGLRTAGRRTVRRVAFYGKRGWAPGWARLDHSRHP